MHGILKTLLGWYCCFDLIMVRKLRIREVKWLMHSVSSYSGMELEFKQGQADPECPGSQGLHAFMSYPLSLIGEAPKSPTVPHLPIIFFITFVPSGIFFLIIYAYSINSMRTNTLYYHSGPTCCGNRAGSQQQPHMFLSKEWQSPRKGYCNSCFMTEKTGFYGKGRTHLTW